MANEKKNTNELVSEDDDPTSELEALTWRHALSAERGSPNEESEARTFDFDRDDGDDSGTDPAIEQLRSQLQSRSETIDRLQFDIEQLHAKWVGLETEIKAREELTSKIAGDLDKERDANGRKDKLLAKRDQSIKALRSEIRDRDQQYREIESRSRDLEQRLGEREDTLAELREQCDSIRAELETALGSERNASKRVVSEPYGQLASRDALIGELREQLRRTESYADGIRQQLHDRIQLGDDLSAAHDRMAAALEHAEAQVGTLTEALDEAREANAGHGKELEELRRAHDEEIRTIRFELGEAQETVSQHTLINEQLTADLIDARGFKAELERMLSESETHRRSSVEDMEKELARLREETEGHARELQIKNEAINCLLAELSQKTQQIESIGKLENVIHEIDDRMSERFEERGSGERDKVTRLLIGTIDEQELRFPLFKNRLTIGRTRQNDIQLKAPYVSRRHAVVVTEGDRTRVVDWGSKNGVYVNSDRITEHFLSNGDIVTIGTADFRYEERPKRDA